MPALCHVSSFLVLSYLVDGCLALPVGVHPCPLQFLVAGLACTRRGDDGVVNPVPPGTCGRQRIAGAKNSSCRPAASQRSPATCAFDLA